MNTSSRNKRQKKTPKTVKMPPPDTLMTPTVVKILAISNMMTIKELGSLGQTSKSSQGALDDEVWKCILQHMDYRIPNDVVATLGHKWILKHAVSIKHCLPPTDLKGIEIPPPRISRRDMIIIYEIGFQDADGKKNVRHGTFTACKVFELVNFGGVYVDVEPLDIGDVLRDSDEVYPNWIEGQTYNIWLKVQLIRIPDKKMCCIYSNGLYQIEAGHFGPIKLELIDTSDMGGDNHDVQDPYSMDNNTRSIPLMFHIKCKPEDKIAGLQLQ